MESHRGFRPYSRLILGQFVEHFHRQVYGGIFDPESRLSDESGFRADVVRAVRELRVPVVRWPGGCFVSSYHWTDGVGANRRPTFDKAWHVEDPNTFGTDEFVRWCRKVGAEPYICTNAGTGDPEEMSNWVEYCNGRLGRWARMRMESGSAQPHDVRYWSIGNENYGDWEMGAKTAEQWAPFVTESAKMMLYTDPGLKLSAAATADIDWTLPLLRRAGKYLAYASIHKYWDPLWVSNEPSSYKECMMASTDPELVINLTRSIIHAAGFQGKIAFDEWNLRGWHHPPANGVHAGDVAARAKNDINSTYTMADAVFSACFLNACLRNCDAVEMACMAPLVNARGPLFTYDSGIVRRTTYHVLWMYANLLERNVVSTFTESDSLRYDGVSRMKLQGEVPTIDAVATCDDQMQRWRLVLVNRHPTDPLVCRVRLGGTELAGAVDATVLSGDDADAYNDIDSPDRVVPTTTRLSFSGGVASLPPHSLSVIEVQR
ncbi:MAG TPA: alpha-L-arabinofuranosidase C-terminal domain-containing protein [Spirochaetia bacterium]|nr:alpha-L-arabinofuranosidase C-terminal domain-containing protein [Spirochaetia bacterium]